MCVTRCLRSLLNLRRCITLCRCGHVAFSLWNCGWGTFLLCFFSKDSMTVPLRNCAKMVLSLQVRFKLSPSIRIRRPMTLLAVSWKAPKSRCRRAMQRGHAMPESLLLRRFQQSLWHLVAAFCLESLICFSGKMNQKDKDGVVFSSHRLVDNGKNVDFLANKSFTARWEEAHDFLDRSDEGAPLEVLAPPWCLGDSHPSGWDDFGSTA